MAKGGKPLMIDSPLLKKGGVSREEMRGGKQNVEGQKSQQKTKKTLGKPQNEGSRNSFEIERKKQQKRQKKKNEDRAITSK